MMNCHNIMQGTQRVAVQNIRLFRSCPMLWVGLLIPFVHNCYRRSWKRIQNESRAAANGRSDSCWTGWGYGISWQGWPSAEGCPWSAGTYIISMPHYFREGERWVTEVIDVVLVSVLPCRVPVSVLAFVLDKNHDVWWEALRFMISGLCGRYRVRLLMPVVTLITAYVCCILVQWTQIEKNHKIKQK